MKIKVNDETVELKDGSTVQDLAVEKQLPEKGIAIAVNNDMVTRSEWQNRVLNEGDDVIIIRAVCGG